MFSDRLQDIGDFLDVGNFYSYQRQIPPIWGSVILPNSPSAETTRSLDRMTGYTFKRIFSGVGDFHRCRLQILGSLSGNNFGWNGI